MITVTCACGNSVSVDDRFAGRTAQCPSCQATVKIPPAAAPASPFPTPQPAWGPGVPGLYSQAPAGYYPQQGFAPPRQAKRSGKAGAITVCILLLLTAVIPWMVIDGVFTWSWDKLRGADNSTMAFIIGSWAIALVLIVLACFLRDLPFSASLTLLAAGGLVLMVISMDQTGGLSALLGELKDEPVRLAAIICLLVLMVTTSINVRVDGNLVVRILQGLAAAGFIVLAIIDYRLVLMDFIDKLSSFDATQLADDSTYLQSFIVEGALHLSVLLMLIGALLALIHGAAIPIKGVGLAKASGVLVRMGAGLFVTDLIAAPAVGGAPSGILPMAVMLILLLSMPVLLSKGVVNLVSDLVLKLRPKTAGQ